jgi:hypothetical protein
MTTINFFQNLIECSVSSSAPNTLSSIALPPPTTSSATFQTSDKEEGSIKNRSRAGSLLDLSSNPLYGLHALNNLDIAVNGKEVNSMPSYRDIRRRGGFEGSGGSDDNSSAVLERYETR